MISKIISIKSCFLKKYLLHAVKFPTFMFNDVYYKHVYGVAMVSPFRPTLANLFLVYYENK